MQLFLVPVAHARLLMPNRSFLDRMLHARFVDDNLEAMLKIPHIEGWNDYTVTILPLPVNVPQKAPDSHLDEDDRADVLVLRVHLNKIFRLLRFN